MTPTTAMPNRTWPLLNMSSIGSANLFCAAEDPNQPQYQQEYLDKLFRGNDKPSNAENANKAKDDAEFRTEASDAKAHLKGLPSDSIQIKGLDAAPVGLKGLPPEGTPLGIKGAPGVPRKLPDVDARSLGTLVNAIERAEKVPGCIGPDRCNFFVGEVAEIAKVPYFDCILAHCTSDNKTANRIYDFIQKAGQSRAKRLANCLFG